MSIGATARCYWVVVIGLFVTGCGRDGIDQNDAVACAVNAVKNHSAGVESLSKILGQNQSFEILNVRMGECIKSGPGEFLCQLEYDAKLKTDNPLLQALAGGKTEIQERVVKKWKFIKGPSTFTCEAVKD